MQHWGKNSTSCDEKLQQNFQDKVANSGVEPERPQA